MRRDAVHWPEYAIEAVCLGLFMVSAAGFASLLRHPSSPLASTVAALAPASLQRLPMGIAMGLTAATIIYSPLGRRSGAHMNPAVTVAFLRLGKIAAHDAAAYVAAQFVGGVAGIVAATWLLRGLPAHPAINYIATVPGPPGAAAAFAAEAVMSFGMMLMVLSTSNVRRLARFTGALAGVLIAIYISVEDPHEPRADARAGAARAHRPVTLDLFHRSVAGNVARGRSLRPHPRLGSRAVREAASSGGCAVHLPLPVHGESRMTHYDVIII